MPPARRRDNLNDRSNRVDQNFKKAAASGRQLALVVGGVSGSLTSAVGAAGNLAEQLALVSRNAKVAASAAGIGALVAVGLSVFTVWKSATDQMKQFNAVMNRIGGDTQVAQLQGISAAKDLQARRQQIVNAGEQELKIAEQIKNKEERRVALAAIYKKTREELAALERQAARDQERAFRAGHFESEDTRRLQQARFDAARMGPIAGARRIRTEELEVERDSSLRRLKDENLNPDQFAARRREILDLYANETKLLEIDLQAMAFQVGDVFASSLADSISAGIETAIASGSIGKGFQALGATALSALGGTLQEYGIQALTAAKWLAAIQRWLFANPMAAIPAAIGLIAFGGALKAIGGKWSSDLSSGIGRSGGSGPGGFGGNSRSEYVGVVYPMAPVGMSGLRPVQPVNINNPIFVGTRDPVWQRQLLETLKHAGVRGTV